MIDVVDEFTHECLAIRIARKLKSIDVIDVMWLQRPRSVWRQNHLSTNIQWGPVNCVPWVLVFLKPLRLVLSAALE